MPQSFDHVAPPTGGYYLKPNAFTTVEMALEQGLTGDQISRKLGLSRTAIGLRYRALKDALGVESNYQLFYLLGMYGYQQAPTEDI